jgi:glycosyltransferase involved in cell wall biosynthesis
MRIALVAQEYPPETARGGIGTQTFLKAHGLAALGHEVHVVSRAVKGPRRDDADGRVRVTRVPAAADAALLHTEIADWIAYSTAVAAVVAELNAAKPFDLVEFPEWACEGWFHLVNRTEWNRVRTAIHLHGPLVMFAHTMGWPALDSEFFRTGTAMEGACLRLADAVFSSSRCSADWCAKHYGLDADRIPIWHSGVDVELFSPRDTPKAARPTIVFAGKLARNKGVHLLVEAACALAREFPGLHLSLLGRGEPGIVAELQALAKAAGCADLLDMPGFVDRAQLPEHLSRAHIFAAPSEYEGGPGFVYLEAMACGLPVIACAGSGAAEAVRHGETGLLVPPRNPTALALALRRLLGDAAQRERLGAQARRFALAEADSRQCVRKLEALYRDIIAGTGPFAQKP